MAARLLIDHSEHRHRRRRLYQNDPVENEVAIPQAALEGYPVSIIQLSGYSALSFSRRAYLIGLEGIVTAVVFHPSIFTFHSGTSLGLPLATVSDGTYAVSSRSSPGISSM
jgi:hypothetical protein